MDVSGKEAHVRSFIALKMEAVRTSETSANFNVTTRRYKQKTPNFKKPILRK
jgi:hypothetical protein